MAAIQERDGKLEVDFNKKVSVIDMKNSDDTVKQLLWMIVTLDQRVQTLEQRLG
jgi:hypothetical protein